MDEEAKLQISVEASAKKGTGEKAYDNLNKEANKKGPVKIPVDITVPIDKVNAKLTKAQKDITDEIGNMTSKGFSASGKDMDKLTSKLNTFLITAKEAGKDNRNPVVKAINQQVKLLQQEHKELLKVEQSTRDYEAKINKAKSSIARTSNVKLEKEIKKASTSSVDTHKLGLKQSVWDDTYNGVTDKNGRKPLILNNNRLGPYYGRNDLMRSMTTTEKLNKRALVNSRSADIESANKMANEAYKKGDNKNNLTAQERAKGIAHAILPELARVLGGIQHGREDSSPEDFFQILETVLNLNQEAGMSSLKSASEVLNMTLHKWFNTDGTLGLNDETKSIDQTRAPEVQSVLKSMLARLDKLQESIVAETIATEKETKTKKRQSKKVQRGVNDNSIASRIINQTKMNTQTQNRKLDNVAQALNEQSKIATNSYAQEIRESSREGVADERELKIADQNKTADIGVLDTVKDDYTTGMNTTGSATKLFTYLESIKTTLDGMGQYMNAIQTSLSGTIQVSQEREEEEEEEENKLPTDMIYDPKTNKFYKSKVSDDLTEEQQRKLIAEQQERTEYNQYEQAKKVRRENAKIEQKAKQEAERAEKLKPTPITEEIKNRVEEERAQVERGEFEPERRVSSLKVITSQKGFFAKIGKLMDNLTGTTTEVDRIMAMNSKQQDRMRAERIATFGENKGRDLKETGSKAAIRYIKTLFGWLYKNDASNRSLFQDIKLTSPEDVFKEIDTTKIMEGLNKALSGSQMFKAQTGGVLRNIIGSMTLYAGMPSIEKTRTQADAVNQIMSDVRKEVLALIQDIQAKESALRGMEDAGMIKFNQERSNC